MCLALREISVNQAAKQAITKQSARTPCWRQPYGACSRGWSHWRVEQGELVNLGTGPYATTDESFGDYELLIEYKTVAKADSGIYLRGQPQVQIWDKNQIFDPKKPDRRPHLGSGGLFNNSG